MTVARERIARIHRLTAHLSTALHVEDVAAIVVDEGTTAIGAVSGALWRVEDDRLQLLRSKGFPPDAIAAVQTMPLDAAIPVADAVIRGEAVWLVSRADYEARYGASASRTSVMVRPAAFCVAALPVMVDDTAMGVIALTFADEHEFDEDERAYLEILALHCAQGFERTRLYERETMSKARLAFLARASAVLGRSLDFEETLQNVASLAVPTVGDWCAIDLVSDDGTLRDVVVAHVDPAKVTLAKQLREKYPPDPNATTGAPNVARTGKSEWYAEIPPELIEAAAVDAEHLRISRELGLRSAMCVPIRTGETVVGAITFVLSDSPRRYTADDLLMAEQLGERAGAAISNARHYAAARAAVRVRDEFMLIAGHELRTPIAAISLHHEALSHTKDGTPIEKVRERGVKLQSQSERLARLVEDLLDVSRISAGRLTLERDDVSLDAIVAEIAERMGDELERARSPLALTLEPVRGRWDRARIDQIVTNLLGNAAKYGKGSPIELAVRAVGDDAEIVVTDHGIGIAIEDQPRIFERFERAVSTRKFGGLGLGLWIVRQLVDAHGGTIAVVSAPGAGATFTVRLPRAAPGESTRTPNS